MVVITEIVQPVRRANEGQMAMRSILRGADVNVVYDREGSMLSQTHYPTRRTWKV